MIRTTIGAFAVLAAMSSCNDFIFGKIEINEEDNPLIQKKTPRSGAEIYYGDEAGQHKLPVDKNAVVKNRDADGVFANWYTCLVMIKEGHPHGGGKMHGNNVYDKSAWRQEQFVEIRNTPSGPEVKVDSKSVSTFIEQTTHKKEPDYLRIVGGSKKLWGLCLYFYDKEGKLLNDSILKHSDEYQIFFTISDKNEKNEPYDVLDVRYTKEHNGEVTEKTRIEGVPAKAFENVKTFEQRGEATKKLFNYVYRDTWHHTDMGDGTRELFNIKLQSPLTPKDYLDARWPEDQDYVGLKGHFCFNLFEANYDERPWPLELSDKGEGISRKYGRQTYLLPKLCIAVRVMKCKKGTKATLPIAADKGAKSKNMCQPYHTYQFGSDWKEVVRFNLPVKVFSTTYDSDPTNTDPYEPHYYHISRELELTPQEAFEIANGGSSGIEGLGYGAWFL